MSSMVQATTVAIQPEPTNHNSLSNQNAMSAIYAQSPCFDGSYSPEQVRAEGNKYLLGKDGGADDWATATSHWGFSAETTQVYSQNGAPSYADVDTGAGGAPSTAFTPNLVSPGPGSLNAADMAELPAEYHPTEKEQWGNGPGISAMSPSVSADRIQDAITIGGTVGGNSGTVAAGTRSWSDNGAG